jgi:hypothetical protein
MPSVSKETLDLIRAMATQEARLDGVRTEIQRLQDELKVLQHHKGKLWDRFWVVSAAVISAVITSTLTYLLTRK